MNDLSSEVLLPYQKRWVADTSDRKIAEKSRRTGLTWAEAADAVLTASAAKSAGGSDHFYIGSGKEMAVEFIDAAAMWAKAFNKASSEIEATEELFRDGDEEKSIQVYTIYFGSGFKIQALSSSPKNMRGRQGNVTIDEAAFHEHFAEVVKAAGAMRMWGGKLRIISTHNGVENPFNELINDCRSGRKKYSLHRITLDDACDQGLFKRICQIRGVEWTQTEEDKWKAELLEDTLTKEDAMEEYYCVPKSGGGAYLSRAMIEARMFDAPVIRYSGTAEFNLWPEHLRFAEMQDWCVENLLPLLEILDPSEPHFFGEDFARSGDLTVIAPMSLGQKMTRKVPFLVELHNVPYKQQEQVLFYIADRLPRFVGAAMDARGNGEYLAEQARYRYGSRVVEVKLSQSWYLENMPPFKANMEDDLIRIPRDRDVVDDLRAIQVVNGIPKIPDGQTSKNRHGDSAIAIVMAHTASKQDITEYGYHPVRKSNQKQDRDKRDGRDPYHRQIKITSGIRRGML